MSHCGGGKFKKVMSHADKVGARFAIIIGDDEIAKGMVQVKDLSKGEQVELNYSGLVDFINNNI
jgi:histidyl-tRNA synthetase